jgi:hypothetical protein
MFIAVTFFFNLHYNPGWVSAYSTVLEHSQQEGFTECRCQRHVKPPTWSRTRDLERSNFGHKRSPASEATLANPTAEGGTMGEKWPINFAESDNFHVTFGFFYMACGGFFFARKIRQFRPGLNPRTWVPKGQHATSRPPKPQL